MFQGRRDFKKILISLQTIQKAEDLLKMDVRVNHDVKNSQPSFLLGGGCFLNISKSEKFKSDLMFLHPFQKSHGFFSAILISICMIQ